MKLEELLSVLKDYAKESLYKYEIPYTYLTENRTLTEEAIKRFDIGYIPFNEEHVFDRVDKKWISYHHLGGYRYNKFRLYHEGRIVFPIYDSYGTIVALQGRRLNDDAESIKNKYKTNDRKYWHNSFNKSRVIFGLNWAIPAIRKAHEVIVTEGQFDVVRAYQVGIENIVCSSSTVLNDSLISLLARYTKKITIVFDNDAGGQKAIDKLRKKAPVGIEIRFVILPSEGGKQDLDTFLRDQGLEEFEKLLLTRSNKDTLLSCFSKL